MRALRRRRSAGARATRRSAVLHTDRGDLRSELVVDALGWRRVLSNRQPIQPPNARLSRGLEVHPGGASPDLEVLLDPQYVRAGYSWSFPAGDEVRVGVGSFDPRAHVKEPTVRLAGDRGLPPDGFQGNWIPHKMRDAVEDDVFFAGDSAGHCLPATAEGIRPALFFGQLCGRELRAVLEGSQAREQALARYAAEHEDRRWAWRWLLRNAAPDRPRSPLSGDDDARRGDERRALRRMGDDALPADLPATADGGAGRRELRAESAAAPGVTTSFRSPQVGCVRNRDAGARCARAGHARGRRDDAAPRWRVRSTPRRAPRPAASPRARR